jgi:hypothetical protein
MGDDHTPALMSAFAVAMSARTGMLSPHATEDMRIKAEELMPRDHAAYGAILTFATQYELHRRDAEALKSLGEDLERALRAAIAPAAPDWTQRRDING